jgi:hypothetical protein
MPEPYWTDGQITLYLGDCREVTGWLAADVLVTDPPYGIGWRRGGGTGDTLASGGRTAPGHPGIANDQDTSVRDAALALWGARPALVFGSFDAPAPAERRQTLAWRKWANSGVIGSTTGWRRDVEPIFVVGDWPRRTAQRSALLVASGTSGGAGSVAGRYEHPHAKPGDVMETLISACPDGTIADPFAGSGSTLVAARNLGRRAIGVEVDERYCERAARRLSQGVLPLAANL